VARFRQAGMLAQAAECLPILSLDTGLQGLGELEASQKFAENAIQLSRMAGDPRQEAIGLRRLAIVSLDQGKFQEALPICEQALTLHRELGDRHEECMALNALAVILSWFGRHADAYDHFMRSFEMAQEIGSNLGYWMVFGNVTWYYYRREGLYEAGLAFTNEQLARYDASIDPTLVTSMLEVKAILQHQLGLYPQAIETLRETISLADRFSGPLVRANLRLKVAILQAEIRHFSDANAALEDAWKLSAKFERPADIAGLYLTAAEVARMEWEAGDLKQIRRAAAQIQQAITMLRSTHWQFELARVLQTAAWVELAHNHPEQALAYSQEAMDLLAIVPVKPEGYQYVHVCALWANGRDEEANSLLEQAYLRVMLVAGHIKDDTTRNCWLDDVPVNHQIVNDWVGYHGL
jgi:tetratricopeptide (TPR) repeat protein